VVEWQDQGEEKDTRERQDKGKEVRADRANESRTEEVNSTVQEQDVQCLPSEPKAEARADGQQF